MLAEATGWKGRLIPLEASAPSTDMVAEVAGRMANALHDAPETAEAEPGAPPCEYLGEQGCTFPTDLRPFGCTAYVCKYMYERLDRQSLARIKRLVRELEEKHTILLRTVRNVRWSDEAE